MSQATPNRAVNTDAPRAALRARGGSPVTLVRWASHSARLVARARTQAERKQHKPPLLHNSCDLTRNIYGPNWGMTMKTYLLFFVLSVVSMPAFGQTATIARAHSEAFARAMNAQDIDATLALYAEDARVIWPGVGDEAQGKIAIRALIVSTLKSFPKDSRLELKSQDAMALGDGYIATVSHWEQAYTRDDGTKATVQARATEIIRVNERGSLYVIDHASFGR